jgi:hypothetical protein
VVIVFIISGTLLFFAVICFCKQSNEQQRYQRRRRRFGDEPLMLGENEANMRDSFLHQVDERLGAQQTSWCKQYDLSNQRMVWKHITLTLPSDTPVGASTPRDGYSTSGALSGLSFGESSTGSLANTNRY